MSAGAMGLPRRQIAALIGIDEDTLKHISGVVDIPNACATLYVPTEIFSFDIRPNAKGPKKYVKGPVDLATVK